MLYSLYDPMWDTNDVLRKLEKYLVIMIMKLKY